MAIKNRVLFKPDDLYTGTVLRATAAIAVAGLSHRSSVRSSVCLSVRHTSDSVKNDAS